VKICLFPCSVLVLLLIMSCHNAGIIKFPDSETPTNDIYIYIYIY
jgi:hypothetical protein